MNLRLLILFQLVFFISCKNGTKKEEQLSSITQPQFKIKNVFPHDMNSFTEGLFLSEGKLYESTGSPESIPNTKSVFGILNLETGKIDVKAELDKTIYFGEGIAKANNKIFQLTYLNKTGFVYDADTFEKIDTFKFQNDEGWGLTNIDNETLIMSDGTNVLTFMDVETLKPIKSIKVTEFGNPVYRLNELEYVNGCVYANIYTENRIVKIDVNDERVIKSIDLYSLYFDAKNRFSGSMEMNGIAYDEKEKTFYITGKMWPNVYEIEILD
ncbi:glutaminyl-peptide cyclotransferase [Flavobacterium sp. 316]|uniref:glutaminyl-peptide cyclotransferase n=1 Tax=Flavobacterium sp. 316 TaxID=1603293 RepID=UPI000696AAE7|nr:glutaminyl-peptide cyclotransferase [Flavobacterium sp. 316]